MQYVNYPKINKFFQAAAIYIYVYTSLLFAYLLSIREFKPLKGLYPKVYNDASKIISLG